MMVRVPRSSAWRIEWVTISTVSPKRPASVVGQPEHELGIGRVERGGVLVEQHDGGGGERRHDQRQRLPLAAGERAHRLAEPALQPDAELGDALRDRPQLGAGQRVAEAAPCAAPRGERQVLARW